MLFKHLRTTEGPVLIFADTVEETVAIFIQNNFFAAKLISFYVYFLCRVTMKIILREKAIQK